MRLIITCPCSWFNAKKRQFHFGQFFFVNLLMLFYITKLSSVFCFFFSLLSLSISLITFSPIHHSGVAPAHWLKPLCCQVIFLLAGSKIVWLTLSFDSISLHWFCVVFLILSFNTILEQTVCVWYINGCELWRDHLTCCWVHSSVKGYVCSLCRECFSFYVFACTLTFLVSFRWVRHVNKLILERTISYFFQGNFKIRWQ